MTADDKTTAVAMADAEGGEKTAPAGATGDKAQPTPEELGQFRARLAVLEAQVDAMTVCGSTAGSGDWESCIAREMDARGYRPGGEPKAKAAADVGPE